MKLTAKLVIIMLTLLIIAVFILFTLNQLSQNDLVQEIQESSTEVSKAIQMSVEDLTSADDSQTSRLTEYMKQARAKGINEINIINTEGEIIDSSDPAKVGKKRDVHKMERGLKATQGHRPAAGSSLKPYNLTVPVIVGDEQLGFIQINLLLDNIRDIQHANFLRRLVGTIMVFLLGITLSLFLARRYTSPINRLVDGVKKVAAGDLTVTFPVQGTDEIGELARSCNEMVEQLRERQTLEQRLNEAEHLSKVGQLASGIAHEIRNPLNYISLAIDHLKEEFRTDCPERSRELAAIADNIKEEVRKANYMVLNFMNYGRPLKLRRMVVPYREIVTKALVLLEGKLAEQEIRVVLQIPDDLPPLWVDPELMRNCITNFITNAGQAMPEGGTIALGATYAPDERLIRLTFSDQGVGIPPEDLDKIFQPYFTSKEAGIGLGLAITERIIREHGGEIGIVSSVGAGTTFTVALPAEIADRSIKKET
ncbi:sensor histidine kinase [Geobacter argillaceus]|uniref:histidine kinase n=1 Tax=Geobacter argillaceus TaxID=345631 RepID=A0A562VNW1_9BACT|nr:ATP-binding protein [Geobacter argillaceus]TWJ19589.1 signal transduction histidine kinase [Geobacter argillaceus]